MAMHTTRTRIAGIVGIVLLALLCAGQAPAHNIKDRVKVPMDMDAPAVDDVAYFVESYVFAHLYDDGTAATHERFMVREFDTVEQNGAEIVVRFTTLDKKGNKSMEDSMAMRRGPDGVWLYQPAGGGEPMEVYTYVTRAAFNWETRWKPLLMGLGALAALSPAALWHVRRRERRAMAARAEAEELAAEHGAGGGGA
jgi:hypothetical protein